MIWHVVFSEPGQSAQSRAARSRDHAIQMACELLSQSYDVRRILEPNGRSIERTELDQHFDGGRFPGLRSMIGSMTRDLAGTRRIPIRRSIEGQPDPQWFSVTGRRGDVRVCWRDHGRHIEMPSFKTSRGTCN
jgi:hypothetical protein